MKHLVLRPTSVIIQFGIIASMLILPVTTLASTSAVRFNFDSLENLLLLFSFVSGFILFIIMLNNAVALTRPSQHAGKEVSIRGIILYGIAAIGLMSLPTFIFSSSQTFFGNYSGLMNTLSINESLDNMNFHQKSTLFPIFDLRLLIGAIKIFGLISFSRAFLVLKAYADHGRTNIFRPIFTYLVVGAILWNINIFSHILASATGFSFLDISNW